METELSEMGRGTGNWQLRKTRPGGKETLLRPYAPLGATKTDEGGRCLGYVCHLEQKPLRTKELTTISNTMTVSQQSPVSVFLLRINLSRVFERLLARKKAYCSLSCGQACKFVKS